MGDIPVILGWLLIVILWVRVVCKPGRRCSKEEQKAALSDHHQFWFDIYVSRGYTQKAARQAVVARFAELSQTDTTRRNP